MKVLVLSVSAGNGHVRAAQALEATAALLPHATEFRHVDAMDFVASGFRKVYTDWYIKLVNRHPEVWSYVHQISDSTPHSATSQKLRRALERLSSQKLIELVHQENPDIVICTHFLPAELLNREANHQRLSCPIWMQVTDYDLHNMWLIPGLAGYFAATDEVAYRMVQRGLDPERIHVTGIPVMPAFSDRQAMAVDKSRARAGLNLKSDRKVVLMSSGGAGIGDLPSMVESVLKRGGDFQIISVSGRNESSKQKLDELALQYPDRLRSIGFTQEMHVLMAASDLVVTKPGGLTVSECLALGRPMLLISPIPGQEEHNATYLLEEGAAWLAYDDIGLHFKLNRLMTDEALLNKMAHECLRLGKPRASFDVLNQVLSSKQATA